jgi:glutamate synthase (ferredoxin)
MSGGIAYVLDQHGEFRSRCNREMVELTGIEDAGELELVKNMIFRHAEYTGSRRATEILVSWDEMISRFVRVIPSDYKRVIEAEKGTIDFELRIGDQLAKSADFSG